MAGLTDEQDEQDGHGDLESVKGGFDSRARFKMPKFFRALSPKGCIMGQSRRMSGYLLKFRKNESEVSTSLRRRHSEIERCRYRNIRG